MPPFTRALRVGVAFAELISPTPAEGGVSG